MTYLRGEVYRANLPSIEGSKFAVVVSRNSVNRNMKPVVALVTSTQRERTIPSVVQLEAGEAGMTERCWIQCHELWTARPKWLSEDPVGTIPPSKLVEVERRLGHVFEIEQRGRR